MSDAFSNHSLPAGKLPPDLLRNLLDGIAERPEVIVGPGVGRDVAVVDLGDGTYLALKSDPITFATEHIGWYALNVNANDLATVGATPRWFLATVLLPATTADARMATDVMDGLRRAAEALDVALVGGHTEVTGAVDRPVVSGTLVGTVSESDLVRPDGLQEGDALLLTGGLAIEATSIVARELPEQLARSGLSDAEVAEAADYLFRPGIGVTDVSRIARSAARVHAMHDPTEGGVATAIAEMAEASRLHIEVDMNILHDACTPLTRRVCEAVEIDPLGAISSGALLIGVAERDVAETLAALGGGGIPAWRVGTATDGSGVSTVSRDAWPEFAVDEIARLF